MYPGEQIVIIVERVTGVGSARHIGFVVINEYIVCPLMDQ